MLTSPRHSPHTLLGDDSMGLEQASRKTTAASAVDYDSYRLRTFVEALNDAEIERRSGRSKLAEVARALEANPKAVLFESAGAEGHALVGNALASRSRFAKAFG